MILNIFDFTVGEIIHADDFLSPREELIQKMKIPKLRDNMHGLIEERMG